MDQYRITPIHRSVTRPQLLVGAERQVALGVIVISLVMGYGGYLAFNMALVGGAVVLYIGLMILARQMAKVDPDMAKIYLRHVRYKGVYKAHSSPWRLDR